MASRKLRHRSLLPTLLPALLFVAGVHGAERPRVQVVTDTVHGVAIHDPYRWMESGGAEFDAWAKAESATARATLDSIPGRNALHRRIAALDAPSGGIAGLQVRNGRWLYRRVPDGGTAPKLFTRLGPDGEEREVDLLGSLPAAEGPWSRVPAAEALSPDGRHLTFGTTRKGEADPTLRVYDLERHRLLPDAIAWPLVQDAHGFRARWLADGSGFLYVRRPDAGAAMDNVARARRGQVFVHRLGEPPAGDRALFGFGLTPEIEETDTLYVEGEPHPRWLTVWRRMPEGRELWVLDLAGQAPGKLPPARRIWASDVSVPGYGVHGDGLYVVDTADDSPRFRVVRYDLASPAPRPQVVLPQQPGVLGRLVAADDAVYVVESLLSQARMHVLAPAGNRAVDLPPGTIDALTVGPEGRGAWFSQVDWLQPRRGLLLDPGARAPRTVDAASAAPSSDAAPNGYASQLRWAIARDGERIPYTIVQRADAAADGSAYVMMDGYGCFGSADPPFYWPSLQAWLERGGAFVRVAMRGGGELGADWHRAGRDRNKPTAFEDAIDVAKALVREGVTRPGRIGVTGGSCGGMTMGMAALEAPHLIGAAVLAVGAFDPLRMAEHSTAGARSIRDIGDPATTEGVRRIFALSPYLQILDGAPRPALLIGSGATDYTIPLWVGGKMVARAQAASPDGKPVLWDIQWQGGHNAGIDYVQLDTDQMAFLFWQLGHPDFQR